MSHEQDIEQILNSSLPKVSIGRVTLENSGGQFQYKIDPHIDYTTKDDEIGKEFVASGLLNPKRIEGTVLKRSDKETMKVTMNLMVKDVVTASVLSYWFKNRNIVDLLDVRATYTTNPETTDYLLRKNPTLNYENWLNIINIPLNVALKEKGFRNQETRVDNDGNRIHIFSFDYTIEVDNTVEYLAVFSCCRVDLDKLFKKAPDTLQIQTDIVDQLPDDLLAGNLSHNVIIRNGNVSSTITVFIDEETGALWNGPVHQMENGRYMGEQTHSDTSKYLSRRNVPNPWIQDFRITSYSDKRISNLHSTRENLVSEISRNITPQTVQAQKPKSYFSDISFARDAFGQARFFFSMDYHKIIEDYTIFGGLMRKKGLINPNEIARYFCRIVSLKVFRKRIHGSAETGSKPYMVASTINGDTFVPHDPATVPGNFDCNQTDKLIVTTSEEHGQNFLKSTKYSHPITPIAPKIMPQLGERLGLISPVSSLESASQANQDVEIGETVIGTIEEISTIKLNNGEGIRHISGIDKSMPQVTDGYYQYRIEMEIIDRTDEFIRNYLIELQRAKDQLQSYLNEITKPGQEASFTWKVDPHIDYEQEGKTVGRKGKTAFDPRKIKNAVNIYLKTLLLFTSETTAAKNDPARPENGDALRNQLLSLVNARTPNGTYCIIMLMSSLITKISDALKIKELNTLTKFSNENTTLAALKPSLLMNYSKPTISFEIKNTFTNYFNSNVNRATSYDFMDLQNDPSIMGIKVANETEFTKRIDQETRRLFRNPEDSLTFNINDQEFNPGDSSQFTDFSYIAPARINMPGGNSVQIIGSAPGITSPSLIRSADAADGITFTASTAAPIGSEQELEDPALSRTRSAGGGSTGISGGPPVSPGDTLYEANTAGMDFTTSEAWQAYQLTQTETITFQEETSIYSVVPLPPTPEVIMIEDTRSRMTGWGVTVVTDFEYVPHLFDKTIEDPVTKDNKFCDTLTPTVGANPFPVFRRILQEINPNSYQFGGPYQSTGQTSIDGSRAKLAWAVRNASTFYNPSNPSSPANLFLKQFSSWTPNELFRGAPHPNTLTPSQGWTSTTPNHMKVLTKPSLLPTNIGNVIKFTARNISAQSEINLKFFKLDVIEVMVGYQQEQLTKPQWEPLTRNIYNEAIGGTLLCRLKPYVNPLFGVTRDLQAEMPTLDELFLLQPRTRQAAVSVEALAPGLNVPAFPDASTRFLFGDLPNITAETFYVEPKAPTSDEVRFGGRGRKSGKWEAQWEDYTVLVPWEIPFHIDYPLTLDAEQLAALAAQASGEFSEWTPPEFFTGQADIDTSGMPRTDTGTGTGYGFTASGAQATGLLTPSGTTTTGVDTSRFQEGESPPGAVVQLVRPLTA